MQDLLQSLKTNKRTTTENLVNKRQEIKEIIENAQTLLDEVNGELYIRVSKTSEHKLILDSNVISIVTRTSFINVPLDFAKRFRAVKKVVDSSVLKPLYDRGVNIPNVETSSYIKIQEVK